MNLFDRIFGRNNKPQENKLPDGWTETKVSEDTYITHIPQEQKDKWVADRHKRDKVDRLITQNGFHITPTGRSGTIYYVDNGKLCEIDLELSGVKQYDILIYFDNLKEWILPDKKVMTAVEKLHIKEKLILWLDKENIKADL